MGIVTALVDRARVIQREGTGVKVEGTTIMAPTQSEWFKARLFLKNATERKEQGERSKRVATPQIMLGVKDLAGGSISHLEGADIVLRGDVDIEVESVELGNALWKTRGEPEPIRKKRRVIGYLIDVERVVERKRAGVRP